MIATRTGRPAILWIFPRISVVPDTRKWYQRSQYSRKGLVESIGRLTNQSCCRTTCEPRPGGRAIRGSLSLCRIRTRAVWEETPTPAPTAIARRLQGEVFRSPSIIVTNMYNKNGSWNWLLTGRATREKDLRNAAIQKPREKVNGKTPEARAIYR